jgi:dynein heavy chain
MLTMSVFKHSYLHFLIEIDFWNSRLKNLESIYDQLRDPRVKSMASVLELTDSVYFPFFKSQFLNIVAGEY